MTPHDGSSAAPGRRAAVRDPEELLVARLTGLRGPLDGEPDPQFRAATRARLVAMAAVRSPAPAPRTGLRRWLSPRPAAPAGARHGRLTAGLAGAAVAVTALAALVGFSSGAAPGDPLYSIKRGTEQTQLALASDSTRGQTLLDFATTRLDELGDLLAEGTTALPAGGGADGAAGGTVVLAGGADARLVEETLATMDRQTADGTSWLTARAVANGTAAPLDDLLAWTATQSAGLSALVPEVPAEAQDEMASSLTLLDQVSRRGQALSDALDCPTGPATAGSDALGPLPGPCVETPTAASNSEPATGATPTTVPGTLPTDPDAPVGDGGSSAATVTSPPAGTASTGGGTSGSTGSSPSTVPGQVVPTGPGLPTTIPVPTLPLPLPLPGTAGSATSSSASSSTTPPLIHLPLPICLPPLLC